MKRKNILFNLIIFCFSIMQVILGKKVNILIDDMGTIHKETLLDMNNKNINTDTNINNNGNSISNWKGSLMDLKDPLNSSENNRKLDQDNSIICECKIMVSKCKYSILIKLT
ncbi:hypothetical protein [Cryptosporidium parvum Iowa II]|uniref:Uncharacterized protein n=1 Tax=Cryptosporidium parvum (strain Iowa II) TaxID=353152 RepID=Q5CXM8_CRYPI|nr:hypothetical protein [Cryptosporidium parvum Iowa II]EAK89748.1 hypothetical protein cgd6_430 [Cryptosporidium parvum Iowa II]